MIRRPGHLANAWPVVADVAAALARVRALSTAPDDSSDASLDLSLAAANVGRAGGDGGRFASALDAGVQVATDTSGPIDRARLLDLVALAGWRSGVLRLRDDALARLDMLRRSPARVGAAAVLGLEASDLDAFADRQRTDRFWWPGRARQRGYVASFGGFLGLDGPWQAPPDEWRALDVPGAFAVHAGDGWWRLDADVWGSALVRLASEPEASGALDPNVQIVCRPDSYLAWIHVRDAM
ncbi:potassium transporter Kef [Agromyces protaetiae]|uniref:potassium transporter Kef n=1 Tax=Agromyces protaetiae TaxID=2509455 RepID=UPI001FB67E7A|nr:potassium transporter Kef [Agromyces protaetiae]